MAQLCSRSKPFCSSPEEINYMETGKPDLSWQDTNTATLICAVRHKNKVLWLDGKAQLIHGVTPENRQCSHNWRYFDYRQGSYILEIRILTNTTACQCTGMTGKWREEKNEQLQIYTPSLLPSQDITWQT